MLAALRTGTLEESRDEEATRMVVEAYSASADLAGAEAYCRWAIIATPRNLTAHMSLANLLFTGKRTREAYSEYTEVVKLKPDSPDSRSGWAISRWSKKIRRMPGALRGGGAIGEGYGYGADEAGAAVLFLGRFKCVTQAIAGVTSPALLVAGEDAAGAGGI